MVLADVIRRHSPDRRVESHHKIEARIDQLVAIRRHADRLTAAEVTLVESIISRLYREQVVGMTDSLAIRAADELVARFLTRERAS